MQNDKLNLIIVPDEEALKEKNIEDIQVFFKNEVLKVYNDRATMSKRLMKLHLVKEELPKTRLGKIQRFKLIEFVEGILPK